ncbi:right-handed parallel beta-helix repeat-containing protein [Micromonospora sagamiensis]|uniref:Outer membrane repeat protein n=1 Tax=Micromonospora sagamiensis TaxID=47875 RepID=A0A562WER3_9ACTN|nr:right-handed parallel beta-helix repeat-containing protein [Micromonospora sagamiensis]TWJ28367.1 hypothetical protein JD81_01871 [Micromonospora sagamiensis]BCL12741.1 hypothetical protein GCM10017556_04800 [Micromonospora sagamiensis]
MSNYLSNNEASDRASVARRRRRLWLASGVAGLTGVVSIAAVGVAATAGAVGAGGLSWSAAQQAITGGDQGQPGKGGKESPEGGNGKDDKKGKGDKKESGRDHERGKEVPCDTDKLIQAIVYANSSDGGVLKLAKGCTYDLSRNEDGNGLPVITEDITLKGDHTTISREATADYFRILNVGAGGHLTLKGLTIKGGQTSQYLTAPTPEAVWSLYSNSVEMTRAAAAGKPVEKAAVGADKVRTTKKAVVKATPRAGVARPLVEEPGVADGAGILVQPGGSADIVDTAIVHNHSGGNGGGLANFGTTKLSHSTVAHNSAFFFGGGILNAGLLKVTDSKVTDNSAIIGGAGIANGAPRIFDEDIDAGTILLEKTKITENETLGFGGGLLDIGGTTNAHYTQFGGNSALLAGGGVAAIDAQVTLSHTTVDKNSTAGVGGGLAVAFDSAVTLDNVAVKENKAGFFGGGIFNTLSVVTIRHSHITGNEAVGPFGVGGGIFNIFGRVTLDSSKVTHNFARLTGGGIFTFPNGVEVDEESAITANRPNNCAGSPVPNCFG